MRFGLFRYLPESLTMPAGKVAENIMVCRSLRHMGDDLLDLHAEAHIEHAVGFVQHQKTRVVEPQAAALQMVVDASRRADDQARMPCSWRNCLGIASPPIKRAVRISGTGIIC